MTQPVDATMGLVLDEGELEIACKVMSQLAAHPELAHFSFLPPGEFRRLYLCRWYSLR
jgi:hypothetical protein